MATKKYSWGGKRPGAGRPKGSGQGPGPYSRTHRVAVMLTDQELAVLKAKARSERLPVATVAYRLIKAKLAKGSVRDGRNT